jgi:hypothetical protein
MDGVELDDFRLRLRVSEIYQNYRYAKKTQLSLDLKKYRYVGGIQGFRTAKKNVLAGRSIDLNPTLPDHRTWW